MATGFDSAGVALQTLRSNPLNTMLSTLGIVVGIAALVGILSFGDGMEQFARAQIMRNTDFQSIMVSTRTTRVVDGISVKRSYPVVEVADLRDLQLELADAAEVTMVRRHGAVLTRIDAARKDTVTSGATVYAAAANFIQMGGGTIAHGRSLSEADIDSAAPLVVISDSLARRLVGETGVASLVGSTVLVGDADARVVGILGVEERGANLSAVVPITALGHLNPASTPPMLTGRAERIEEVPAIATRIEEWMEARFGGDADAFVVETNSQRVEQVAKGVLLFKIVMGLIVGLSVLVGGIGVMNVLLMSVTERTREIGIRKATGARRKDIVTQFLLESIAISGLGCIAGLAFGAAVVFGASPIIRRGTDMPFDAILSVSTVVVVGSAAILLGLTFGTYPAWRASRLSPVDAIRHE